MKNLFMLFALLFSLKISGAQTYADSILAYREQYKKDFLESERSPIKNGDDLRYLRFFAPDVNYRVTSKFSKTEGTLPFDLPTMNGKTKKYVEYGTLSFVLNGRTLTLRVYQNVLLLEKEEYRNHLFLPFTDETNGEETYGGGRYLDFETTDIGGETLVIDFNKAYNPYCAFADGYSCPKPPIENMLPVEIRAGEKAFAKNIH